MAFFFYAHGPKVGFFIPRIPTLFCFLFMFLFKCNHLSLLSEIPLPCLLLDSLFSASCVLCLRLPSEVFTRFIVFFSGNEKLNKPNSISLPCLGLTSSFPSSPILIFWSILMPSLDCFKILPVVLFNS